MNKYLIFLALVFFLVSFASADRAVNYTTNIALGNFVAGNTVVANFSYYYLTATNNADNSPLIIRLNLTSSNNVSYPVWKGDFVVSGYIERCRWDVGSFAGWCVFGSQTIPFNCSENYTQKITHPVGAQDVIAPNGTFYCYNSEGDLAMTTKDVVFLNLKSNPAIWPGKYNLSAELFYLTDTYPPVVAILNENDFVNKYYKNYSDIEVVTNISDGSPVVEKWGTLFMSAQNTTIPFSHSLNGLYYFTKSLGEVAEGNYNLVIFAVDNSGNMGNDTVTLKIDNTAPNISVISPSNNSITPGNFSLSVNVADVKSGVDNNSVVYRLREISNGAICPEIGIPLGNFSCVRTDWINLPLASANVFTDNINTEKLNLTSGNYWLDVRASDVLGNTGYLK